jgi:Fe2+ or Zn2+ uptake regulation protein
MSGHTQFAQQLKQAGYKLTPARLAVIDVLESNSEHLSHNQILAEGQKIYPKLSRATVYRTMDLLVELRLMRPFYLTDPTQRFISAEGGHHHLICTCCGTTIEFDHCTVSQLAQELSAYHNFQIHNHLLEFRGLCESCWEN